MAKVLLSSAIYIRRAVLTMMISDDLYNLLNRQDWESIILKLTAYAAWLRLMTPTDQEPEDIAMGAIAKVYEGQRAWDPTNQPDLLRHLLSIVKSMISNDANSGVNKGRAELSEAENLTRSDSIHIDDELYSRQLNERIVHDLHGDPELCLVFKALKDEYTPKEISEEYGLPISKVQSAQKRLRRLAARIIGSLERKTHGTEKL